MCEWQVYCVIYRAQTKPEHYVTPLKNVLTYLHLQLMIYYIINEINNTRTKLHAKNFYFCANFTLVIEQ